MSNQQQPEPESQRPRPTAYLARGYDLFRGLEGKPIIGSTPNQRYLGRIVLEVWEPLRAGKHPEEMAYIISPARGVSSDELLLRATRAMNTELERRRKK